MKSANDDDAIAAMAGGVNPPEHTNAIRAFQGCIEEKNDAIARAATLRRCEVFYAGGSKWDGSKGNVSGAMYHQHCLRDDYTDAPRYSARVHGIPFEVAGIIDDFFAFLSCHSDPAFHQPWAERVYRAIPTGADLTSVPDKFADYVFFHPEWMVDYADAKGAYLTGIMAGIFKLRLEGKDQKAEMHDFYHQHIAGLYRHQTQGRRNIGGYTMAALKSISTVDENPSGGWHYFIDNVAHGAAKNQSALYAGKIKQLSEVFLQILKDA